MSNPPKPWVPVRNDDGSIANESLTGAMKAFRKRLKLTRLDDESRLGHSPLSKGEGSGICAIKPPERIPQEVWDRLVELGRLRPIGHGLYELGDS
ncbi:MAG: hypothetical protein AAF628_07475 [Planctomycetota bacterium]